MTPEAVSIQEQPLGRNVKRFRGGLVFKAHRLFYHSTLGSRVIMKKKKKKKVWELTARQSMTPETIAAAVGYRS